MTKATSFKLLHEVYNVAMKSSEPKVLTDFLTEAKIYEHGPAMWAEVRDRFALELAPRGAWAALVGTVVAPDADRKRPERWASGRDADPRKAIHPLPDFAMTLAEEINSYLEDNATYAVDSPRRLSIDAVRAIRKLGENVKPKKEEIQYIMDAIRALHAEVRIASFEAKGQRVATEFARENADLTRKLLRFQDESVASVQGNLN